MYQLGATGPRVKRSPLAPGAAGTLQTLHVMRELVREGSKDVNVREAALKAVRHVAPRDYVGEVRALFGAVQRGIRFTRDPVDVETLQAPRYTLAIGAGDCDDMTTLLAAMIRSVGHGVKLAARAIGTNPATPAVFRHVYLVADVDGRRIALDPSHHATPFGWEFPSPTRALELAL